MNNLTQTQQEIIDSIIAEFESFNKPTQSGDEYDDLISFINDSVSEKERFLQEIRITNKAYDQANKEQVLQIVEKMNKLLNRFDYECKYEYGSDMGSRGFSEYHVVKIYWNGHFCEHRLLENTQIYFNTHRRHNHGIWYLVNSNLTIYTKYMVEGKLNSVGDLLKYVAEQIIEKKKSLIK